MKLFIKAAEIWQPDTSSLMLTLNSSHYGNLGDFQATSRDMAFPYGVGLPGQTWSEQRPLLWTDLHTDQFKRSEAADRAGIACGISIPIFAGEFLSAVVVLFFGQGNEVAGAVEIWSQSPGSQTELKLSEGYYGELEKFEWISRRLTMMRGRGLPGSAWHRNAPVIMTDLGHSNAFLRASNAAECGITTGLALPITSPRQECHILTFLSTRNTPIARRFEIWRVDKTAQCLRFELGHCEEGTDLAARHRDTVIKKGEGAIGHVWLTGNPLITTLFDDASPHYNNCMILMPMIDKGQLSSVVIFVY